jgi:hypothetical protein
MSFNFFDKIFYINLDHREDRRDHMFGVFSRLGILDRVIRVPGIVADPPILGCGLAHLQCIREGIFAKAKNIFVFEDDVMLDGYDHSIFQAAIDDMVHYPEWDMIYLGGDSRKPLERVTDNLNRCWFSLAHSYGVSSNGMEKINSQLSKSLEKIKPGKKGWRRFNRYHHDHWYWQNLETFCTSPLMTKQIDSYSDIERKERSTDNRDWG